MDETKASFREMVPVKMLSEVTVLLLGVLASVSDLRSRAVPRWIPWAMGWMTLLSGMRNGFSEPVNGVLLTAVLLLIVVWYETFRGKSFLGGGDLWVILGFAMAFPLPVNLAALLAGLSAAAVYGIFGKKKVLALVPFLTGGWVFAAYLREPIMNWWLK